MRIPTKFVLLALYIILLYLALTNHQFQEFAGLSSFESNLKENLTKKNLNSSTSTLDMIENIFNLGTPESLKPFVGELLKVYERNFSEYVSNPASVENINMTNISKSLQNLKNPQQELNNVVNRVLEFFKQEIYNQ